MIELVRSFLRFPFHQFVLIRFSRLIEIHRKNQALEKILIIYR